MHSERTSRINAAIETLGSLVSRAGGEGDDALDVIKDAVAYRYALSDEEVRWLAASRTAQAIVGGDPAVPYDLVGTAQELVRYRDALEAARDAMETSAHQHNCDYCRADAAMLRRVLEEGADVRPEDPDA